MEGIGRLKAALVAGKIPVTEEKLATLRAGQTRLVTATASKR